jgi:hypothetical protein
MKLNWGFGIFVTILIFISGMFTLVYLSFQEKINLVYEDYYPKEIAYQKQIDRIQNVSELEEGIRIDVASQKITIIFPAVFKDKQNKGNVLIFRPSDFELDQKFVLNLDSNMMQEIEVKDFLKGKYYVKIDWVSLEKEYYFEKEIFIK